MAVYGIFQSCLGPFSQLYVCMAVSKTCGKGILVGWFLLPNKEAKTYEKVFQVDLNLLGGQPDFLKIIISDFEQAVFKNVRKCTKMSNTKVVDFTIMLRSGRIYVAVFVDFTIMLRSGKI